MKHENPENFPLEADAAQMRLFLNTIFKHCAGTEGWVVLRAFEHEREGAAVVNKWVPFDKNLSLVAIETATQVANRTGAQRAVFSPPVAVFGEGMNDKGDKRFGGERNVIAAPAVAVELDSSPQEALATLKGVLGEPTLVIASGGSWEGQPKLHVYWRLGKPARTEEERATLKHVRLMAARLVGADESGVTLSHPMRWPGSWHTKGAPKLCEIIDTNPLRDITLDFAVKELQDAIDEAGIDLEKRHSDGRAERNGFKTEKAWGRDALFAAADLIPNPPEMDWKPWSNMVMTFFDASHGSPDGLDAAIYWSNKNDKGDEETTAQKWAHVERYPPDNLSAGTLVQRAREVDPDFAPDRIKPEEWFDVDAANAPENQAPLFPEELPNRFEQSGDAGLLEVLTIDQLFTRPDPVFLLDRHIPEKSVGFLYGDPGTGKSFIALDWALTMAFEKPDWFGDQINHKENGCVIYIAGEGASGFKSRVAAWQHRRGISGDQKGRFGLIHQSVDFMSDEDMKRLLATIRKVVRSPVSMIVVDTVSRAMPGADENLQKEMTLFVKACDVVRDAFDCAVLGVHHAGKNGDMRGSTVLRGAGDFIFKLERKRGASIGRLICEKQKDAPDGWSDAYRFDVVTIGPDRSSLVPERCEDGSTGEGAVLTPDASRSVLEAMRDAWMAGEPWGRSHQSGDRWAVRRMVQDFHFAAEQAENVLAVWIGSGAIVEDIASKKSKRKGLRVVDITAVAVEEEEGKTPVSVFD